MHLSSTFSRFALLFSLLSLGIAFSAMAQKSRQQLEREKKENLEKMKEIQGILKETSTQKKVSVGQLNAINQQINTQKKQIDLLSDDLNLLDKELANLIRTKKELDSNMVKMKAEYGKMLYEASKRNAYINQLIFLFSSETFNQFVLRYKYLKQYTEARQGQVKKMEIVQKELVQKAQKITSKKNQQQHVLTTRVKEAGKLEGLKVKQNEVVQELSQKEAQLRAELAESKKAANQLESTIRRLVEREMRERAERERKEREARAKAEKERIAREKAQRDAGKTEQEIAAAAPVEKTPEPGNSGGLTDEEFALASSFTASQNRLPWPVRGFVSDHFGRKAHAVLKGVVVDNLGVDIQTNSGEPVRAVYDGIVLDVTEMPGMGNVIAIQHGDYMTVYAKMQAVIVKAGQKVKARENIGTVATNSEGTSELQFQIWKNTTRLNPESWLIRR